MLEFNSTLLWTIVNLVILFLLLRHFLIKPVTDVMEKRRQMIADDLQNAKDAQDDAMKMKQQYAEALSGAKAESVQIVEKARKEAKAEYDRIVQEAGAKAGSILETAKEDIRVERERTMNALQSEIAGLAVTAAAKIVADRSESQGNQEIYDKFLEEVGEAHEDTDNK